DSVQRSFQSRWRQAFREQLLSLPQKRPMKNPLLASWRLRRSKALHSCPQRARSLCALGQSIKEAHQIHARSPKRIRFCVAHHSKKEALPTSKAPGNQWKQKISPPVSFGEFRERTQTTAYPLSKFHLPVLRKQLILAIADA